MPRPRSWKARSELAAALSPQLAALYPDLTVSLDWETPLQLIVATVLSAQCTDERVNRVTRTLFPSYPDARAYADAPLEALQEAVRPTGFFNNKARHLKGLGRRLVDVYGGEVPRTMEDLLTLPGVARKTANVVLSNAFGLHEGVVVDTHVKRVTHRFGLTNGGRSPEGGEGSHEGAAARGMAPLRVAVDPPWPHDLPRPEAALRGVPGGRSVCERREVRVT